MTDEEFAALPIAIHSSRPFLTADVVRLLGTPLSVGSIGNALARRVGVPITLKGGLIVQLVRAGMAHGGKRRWRFKRVSPADVEL